MQPIKQLLESWAQLVIKGGLARENGIAAEVGGPDHSQHGVGRGVDLVGMVRVIFSTKICVRSNVAVDVTQHLAIS